MAVIAANAADLVSTKLALNSGACEQNPLMARLPFPTVVAAKSASVTLVILSQTQLRKHGHPRLARAIGYIDASAVGAVALSNLRYVR